ncbi:unnamed protein product [Rhizophagus irregularis]|uniref:Uncharacterized protein n=1 Tax=Rhizophagus irregularis TaxID=588596 RepID=A0A915ZQ63_9GLOM|nr:unnamed protein product [Rhizophagus irregularis]
MTYGLHDELRDLSKFTYIQPSINYNIMISKMINFSSSLEKIFTHCRGIMNICSTAEDKEVLVERFRIILRTSPRRIGIIEMKSKDKDQDEDERKWRN